MLKTLEHIYQSAKEVYANLGPGHSEAVYHKAMEVELRLRNIRYSTKCPVSIHYKGHIVGYNEPDIIVNIDDNIIIVELKATTYPPRETEKAQLESYLRTLKTPYGILINFPQPTSKIQGSENIHFLKYGFEKHFDTHANTHTHVSIQDIELIIPTGVYSVPTINLND